MFWSRKKKNYFSDTYSYMYLMPGERILFLFGKRLLANDYKYSVSFIFSSSESLQHEDKIEYHTTHQTERISFLLLI